jgi:mannose-6-phosphate isomerase-like protein (cupin superfamily)
MSAKTRIAETAPFRWEDIPVLAYKEDGGTHFRSITRQILLDDEGTIGTQLRYFEIAPGGHSTLERHEHVHSVMILRGGGDVLVGRQIHAVAGRDLVRVPPRTWHQFRATGTEPLGFLCIVRSERDKPQRPSPADLSGLRADPAVAAFIRV